MLRHKRALHKYSRVKLEEDYLRGLGKGTDIVIVVKQDGDLFLCVTKEGEMKWQKLDADHEKVLEFVRVKSKTYSGIPLVNVKEWAKHDLVYENDS